MKLDEININIVLAIEELKHQDYKGKRVYARITDSDGTGIDTKFDIGVHKDIGMEQDVYCFDLNKLDDSVSLLINTKEQIFTEKLKGFLKLGSLSTRYKDVYDMYWLATAGDMHHTVLLDDIKSIIFNDATMRENSIKDIVSRLSRAFLDTYFITSLRQSKRYNWLDISPTMAIDAIISYIQEL